MAGAGLCADGLSPRFGGARGSLPEASPSTSVSEDFT